MDDSRKEIVGDRETSLREALRRAREDGKLWYVHRNDRDRVYWLSAEPLTAENPTGGECVFVTPDSWYEPYSPGQGIPAHVKAQWP